MKPIKLDQGDKTDFDDPDMIRFLMTLKQYHLEFVIAGGYIRDWYAKEKPNDVDIYILNNHTIAPNNSSLLHTFLSNYKSSFKIIRQNDDHFIELEYRGHKIQLMTWHQSIQEVMDSFDFVHCQFFMPFLGKSNDLFDINGMAFAYNQAAIDAVEEKQLIVTPTNFSSRASDGIQGVLSRLECLIKRGNRFLERGYALPSNLGDIFEEQLIYVDSKYKSTLNKSAGYKSVLLENGCGYYIDRTNPINSKYNFSQIIEESLRGLYKMAPEHIIGHMLSECQIIRQVSTSAYEESK